MDSSGVELRVSRLSMPTGFVIFMYALNTICRFSAPGFLNVELFLVFLKVTLKHSGSLFLYSGDNGGAYAKNSYGNLYVYLSTCAHLGQSMPIGMVMQIWKYLCLPLVEEL